MNDLVAAPPDDSGFVRGENPGQDALKLVPIAGPIVSTSDAISDGNWAAGLVGGGTAAISLLGVIADPLGSLFSAGISWALDHIGPLKDILDKLAGDPATISSFAETWGNVATHMNEVSGTHLGYVAYDATQWSSAAATAYMLVAAGQNLLIQACGVACKGMATGIGIAGAVVGVIRGIVRDLIADFVGKVIARAAEALLIVTLPKVIADIVSMAAKWWKRINEWLDKMLDALEALGTLGKNLAKIMRASTPTRVMPGQGFGETVKAAARSATENPLLSTTSVYKKTANEGAKETDRHINGDR